MRRGHHLPPDLVPVGFIEDWPAEDNHIEDDDEAVENGKGGHLEVWMMTEDKSD